MRFTTATAVALTSVSAASAFWFPASTIGTDLLAGKGLLNLAIDQLINGLGHDTSSCSLRNSALRREWTQMMPYERKAYTDAVLCLQSKPSKLADGLAPGAKSRYDDFVAIHINNTMTIHATANFLAWHRLFVWNYEQALRNECGYTGAQPYWNWGKTAQDPINSPIFDGSDYSMGGNGVYAAHNCTNALPSGANCIPPGAGGGCVTSGPFKNMSVNISPVAPTLTAAGIASTGWLTYQPRCLRRDVSPWVSSRWSTDDQSVTLIKNYNDIKSFQEYMQGVVNGVPFADGFFGVHAGGHYTIGGDPGGDFFASPGDPTFFLHHAQIDRTWWIWQNQDISTRTSASGGIGGSIHMFNDPATPLGTATDFLDMSVLGLSATIGDMLTTQGGPLCYIYI